MVRLKADRLRKVQADMIRFQFLMVRLKEAPAAGDGVVVEHFNSLWCD